jgi:nicotinamide-nucleotide amidase
MRIAAIVSVGEEILAGDIVDTNAAEIAKELRGLGWTLRSIRTVGDDVPVIANALRDAATGSEVVIVTGGLGPTRDDLTREGLAEATGDVLVEDEHAWQAIQDYFARIGRVMNPTNRVQAQRPSRARIVPNPLGTAPGLDARLGPARVFVLPGVPMEMRAMLRETVLPALIADRGGAEPLARARVHAHGVPESTAGQWIAEWMGAGKDPFVGITVSGGILTVSVTARSPTVAARERVTTIADDVWRRFGPHAFGRDGVTIEEALLDVLRARGARLAIAESCTGGLAARLITRVPGASDVFVQGVIAYANAAKVRLLGVAQQALRDHGAVSGVVARQMASGVAASAGVECGIGTTGVAGPGGGTPTKPVGRVEFGVHWRGETWERSATFIGDRESVQLRGARCALDLARRAVLGTLGDDQDRARA